MIADPPTDTMQDRIEEKIRDLLLASPELSSLVIVFRGEPGQVPVKMHPFAVVFLELESDANQDGYGASTGVRNYRFDGYVSVDVVHKDATAIPALPHDRKHDVVSYIQAKTLIQAARKALMAWGGPTGGLEADPVISQDTRERTVEMITENVRNGLTARSENNYSNRSSFDFHIMTTRKFIE